MRVVTGEEDPDASMERDTVASYEALKEFIHKEEGKRRDGDGYVVFRDRMQRVDDGDGLGSERERSKVARLAYKGCSIQIGMDASLHSEERGHRHLETDFDVPGYSVVFVCGQILLLLNGVLFALQGWRDIDDRSEVQ